jgi:glycosyltransferase involved in cell wall biosynthesis
VVQWVYMKLIFDARWTKIGRHDGISRYGSNLLGALMELTPVTVLINDKRQLELLPDGIDYLLVNHPTSPKELFLPFKLNRLGVTVVYSPMQIMGTFGRRYKLIFTLHDLIYYKFPFAPTYLSPFQRAFWWLFHQTYWPGRLVLNRADVVATVSQTSKQEILEHHLTDRPVEVIYNAPSALPAVTVAAQPKKEIVFMGTLMPYKNAEALIRALPLLPGYHLHLTGRGTPDRLTALKALSDLQGVTDRITIWNGASDADYAKVLSTAMASVSASQAEGFGLPVIEAMALGVPFIANDMPIFHEVGGDAALYFDPAKPETLAEQVKKLEDPAVRGEHIKRGHAQAAKFSWQDSAATLLKLVQDLDKKHK